MGSCLTYTAVVKQKIPSNSVHYESVIHITQMFNDISDPKQSPESTLTEQSGASEDLADPFKITEAPETWSDIIITIRPPKARSYITKTNESPRLI